MTEPTRRGRKTKAEEAEDYLRSIGIDPASVLRDAANRPPLEVPDDEQIVAEFKEAVYTAMKLGDLKGTPLVNALKALSILAETAKQNEPDEDEPERGIDEILADAGLPPGRRVEIGRQELARLHTRAAALELVIDNITEAA